MRRWGFRYLSKIPEDAGEYAQAGKKLHAYLEAWLKDGVFPKEENQEARTARAMIKHSKLLPGQTRVEEPFEFELDGVKWRGIKDWVYQDGNTLVIHDHKSTSSLAWVKQPNDLRKDVQSIIYARDAFNEADVVDLEWLYGTRQAKPECEKVRFNITFDEVQAALPPIQAAGKRILELYQENPQPTTLEKSLDSCYAFGKPCSFMEQCGLTLTEQAKALRLQHDIKEEKRMGFRDRIKAVPQAPELSNESINKPSMAERLGFGSAVKPPEYKPSTQVSADANRESTPPTNEMVPDAPPVSEESVAATKPRRGRPPGTKNKAREVVESVAKSVDAVFEQVMNEDVIAPKVTPIRDNTAGFTLCINTIPVGVPYTTLSEFLRPVLEAVQTRNDVDYYRQIDYKGGAMLAAELYSYLQANSFDGVLYVDKDTDEGRDSLPTLERFAKYTYRSVK